MLLFSDMFIDCDSPKRIFLRLLSRLIQLQTTSFFLRLQPLFQLLSRAAVSWAGLCGLYPQTLKLAVYLSQLITKSLTNTSIGPVLQCNVKFKQFGQYTV